MADRQLAALTFGGSIDRGTGPTVADPSTVTDLRNVRLFAGRTAVRKGNARVAATATGDEIVAIHPLRAAGVAALVTYTAATRKCSLWLALGDGSAPAPIGDFWTLPADAASPPSVICADSYDKLFIAHDEPDFAAREATQVFDLTAGTLGDLVAPDPNVGTLRFRGVVAYLAYLFGWGYGTNADQDRPEIVRSCLPADPLTWDINHYFVAGQRADPVLNVDAAGPVAVTQKASETYDIDGTSRLDFGILPGEKFHGLAGSRLSITVGKVNYCWTLNGPRASAGGAESSDLAAALALAGPVPDALAANLDFAAGRAAYDPTEREVLFIFGRWAYVLHLAELPTYKWSFREFGVAIRAAGVLYDIGVTTVPAVPDAHPEFAADASAPTDTTLDPAVTLVGTVHGGETLEWWLSSDADATWVKVATDILTAGQATATHHLTGRPAGVTNRLSARLTRSGLAAALYLSGDPATWPAVSRETRNTTVSTPTITSVTWSTDGTDDFLTLTLASVDGQPHVTWPVQVNGGAGYVLATVTGINRGAGTVTILATAYRGGFVDVTVHQHTVDQDSTESGSAHAFVGDRLVDVRAAVGSEAPLALVCLGDTNVSDAGGGVLGTWGDFRADLSGVLHPIGALTPVVGHEPDVTTTPNALHFGGAAWLNNLDLGLGISDGLDGATLFVVVRSGVTGPRYAVWERVGPVAPQCWITATGKPEFDLADIAVGAVNRSGTWALLAESKAIASGLADGYDGATDLGDGATAYTLGGATNTFHLFNSGGSNPFVGDVCIVVAVARQMNDADVSAMYSALVALALQMGFTVAN